MIVEFGDLCSRPEEAVNYVLKFVGADPAKFTFKPLTLTSGDRRGRRMHPAVRRKLEHYFAVPNQQLFAMVGREFAWGTSEAADEEEGGGLPLKIPVIHARPPPQGQGAGGMGMSKGRAGRSTALELLPGSAVGRKDSQSRLVKRVVSITATV